jgi:hypothetical protein
MMCPICSAITGQGECAECRTMAEELRANAEALSALRHEELPPLVVRISRRAPVYSWVATAAAAVVLLAIALPHLRSRAVPQVAAAPRHPALAVLAGRSEPLKIKMLTPDPDVVIYWLIDSREGE